MCECQCGVAQWWWVPVRLGLLDMEGGEEALIRCGRDGGSLLAVGEN
ncbi:MAG: hypothetical protein ACYS9Y_06415 [Planctomycetota bacterium]